MYAPAKFSYEDYCRLAEAGILVEKHVELIDGEIIEMPPQGEPHGVAILLAVKAMERAFGAGFFVRTQMPLRTGVDEEPEPDVAVIRGEIRDTLTTGRPRSAVLVIEVSGTTLSYDLGLKAEVYATSVEEYWVLDIGSRLLHVHRKTIADPSASRGRRYSQIIVLKETEAIAPLGMPSSTIRIPDLLP